MPPKKGSYAAIYNMFGLMIFFFLYGLVMGAACANSTYSAHVWGSVACELGGLPIGVF